MKKMNMSMIMAVLFLCGILLVGIGTGVAFGEYSALEYGGEKEIGIGDRTEITLEREIAIGKKAKKTILYNHYGDDCELKEDKKVPEGIVRYEIIYDSKQVQPELQYRDYSEVEYNEDETIKDFEGELYIVSQRTVNEMELFMEMKDKVLIDLKSGKISSYLYNPVEKIVVRVNPKTMKYVENRL